MAVYFWARLLLSYLNLFEKSPYLRPKMQVMVLLKAPPWYNYLFRIYRAIMRLDALLPVILIACLLALAYFLTKAVQAANAEAAPPTTQVRLNPDDYRDGTTDSGTATTDDSGNNATASGSGETADLDHLYESPANSPSTSDRAATTGESYSPPANDAGSNTSPDNSSATNSTTSSANSTGSSASSGSSTSSGSTSTASRRASAGKYIVVTGSYRQRVNAERQVANLKREGFPDAEVEIFDRGTYALAVADRFNSRSDAEALARRLVSSGFEAYVKEL